MYNSSCTSCTSRHAPVAQLVFPAFPSTRIYLPDKDKVTFRKVFTDKSLSLQLEYLKLANDLFIETNPIPVKTALNLMGKEAGDLRLPLYEMDENNKAILCSTLQNYSLI